MNILNKKIIYPRVVVYKNMIPNVKEFVELLKYSETSEDSIIFKKWEDWYGFGDFMNIPMPQDINHISEEHKQYLDSNGYEKKQLDFVNKIADVFFTTTKDYIDEYNIELPNWVSGGISICKYKISSPDNQYAMHYHTDYRGADADAPGNKFAITCTIYLNDDYEGGGLKFLREDNGDIIDYKPEAGDIVVFPSGDPITGTSHYFHGVDKISENNKYFIRCFWMYRYEGSEEWHANEKKYGKEKWKEIYNDQVKKSFESGKWHRYVVEPGQSDPKLDKSTPFFRKEKK